MTSYATRLPSIVRIRERAAQDRSRMFRSFAAALPRPLRILDLGGTAEMWARWRVGDSDDFRVTLLNHHRHDSTQRSEKVTQGFIQTRRGDALEIGSNVLRDYDVVFSNSMLEHLASPSDQVALANKIEQCGLPYFIQVPNRRSLVDPHFPHALVPFFAMYPRSVQARLLTWSALGSGSRASSMEAARLRLSLYHPLGRSEMQHLFPRATTLYQWTFGLPMSVIAQRLRLPNGATRA